MIKYIIAFSVLLSLAILGFTNVFAADPYEEQKVINELVLDSPARVSALYPTRLEPVFVSEPPPVPPTPQPDWLCTEWYATSIEAGFTHDDWPDLGVIMYRESRCTPNVHNRSDPAGGSRGLTQVNGSWRGYLRQAGVLWDINELFDPLTNLRAARTIVQYDRDRGNCDWKQWATKQGLC